MQRILNKTSARLATLALGGALFIAAGPSARADTLIALDTDAAGYQYCTGNDAAGTLYANAVEYGTNNQGVRASITTDGGSGSLNGAISCGVDCNSTTCVSRFRRTTVITGVGYTSTRYCNSGEVPLRHGCEIWSPDSYATSESITNYYLGPLGSSYEWVRMYNSVKSKALETVSGPGGTGCGPLGC